MEIVCELDLVLVGTKQVSDGLGLGLREWMSASVALIAWVWAVATWGVPVVGVIPIEINSNVFFSALVFEERVHVLSSWVVYSSLNPFLFDVSETVDIHNWNNKVLVLSQEVVVSLIAVD